MFEEIFFLQISEKKKNYIKKKKKKNAVVDARPC
jgi:hypothetical protein